MYIWPYVKLNAIHVQLTSTANPVSLLFLKASAKHFRSAGLYLHCIGKGENIQREQEIIRMKASRGSSGWEYLSLQLSKSLSS